MAASLLSVVRTAELKDGALAEILKRARRQYGRGFSSFVSNVIAPALVARGLVEARRERSLLFRVTRFYRTPVGDTEVGRLQQAIGAARAIPEYLDRDPAQAGDLVAAVGAAILLVDELRQHYQQLAVALQPRQGWDLGSPADFQAIAGFDFSAFDTLDAGLDAFDASFDSVVGDAGGDGSSDGGSGDSSGC